MLWKALGNCDVPGGIESTQLAVGIETALWKKHNGTKEYGQKFRMLYSNIKDEHNSALRKALFSFQLGVEEVVNLTHEELANPEIQKARKDMVDAVLFERAETKPTATCDMFTCSKCKENKTTYFQLQTRSADEPMTTFVTCVNCGNRWKFC